MKFSLIIPTKNRNEILNQSLVCLQKINNINDLEIIIVNDSEKPININQQLFPGNIHIYKNPKEGVASGRNFGASKAKHDWLIFMDDDMLVKPDTFEKVVMVCSKLYQCCLNINWVYPKEIVEMYGGTPFFRYLKHYGFDTLKGWNRGEKWQEQDVFPVAGITSQFLILEKLLFQKVGGYDESFPFAGFEDYDLKKKLLHEKVTFYIDPVNTIYHNEIDRMQIQNWLDRKKRGAFTRKHAVNVGYHELSLNYPLSKKIRYKLMSVFKTIFVNMAVHWPNTKMLDHFFRILMNMLLGIYSYEGYTLQVNKI